MGMWIIITLCGVLTHGGTGAMEDAARRVTSLRDDAPAAPIAADNATARLADRYRAAARRIIDAALAGNDAYRKLERLCDDVGARLSGSPELDEAIRWAVATMRRDGQDNVHTERVMVPHWVRGAESCAMIKPRPKPLAMLGLGMSVGTPPGGITAPVVVVRNEAELDAKTDEIPGKIVLFNNKMPPYDPERGAGYGRTVRFRAGGARLAAEKGAVACLVRSVTATSLSTPHTGGMRYGDAKVKIPAAAITVEDAGLIARLCGRGVPVVVHLAMAAKTMPDAVSANVIGELRGRTRPEQVVVIGGHLDSWDVGQGAHDDGGGCVIAMEAINVLRKLNLIPRRTIRVVLFTNEENGLAGGRAYAKAHADELPRHIAAIESDSGVFRPTGYSIDCVDETRERAAVEQMGDILTLLSSIGATNAEAGGSGADVGPMKDAGVVLMGHEVDGAKYFDYHHTHADTLDKVDPVELTQNVAVLATVAYILADMDPPIGAPAR
ncbi:MAG: M20/M25/M40 family metallo-hydrolase [Phycisphaerae bacterium]